MTVATRAERAAGPMVVAALGCGALAARPALVRLTAHPTAVLVALFVALLVVGLRTPLTHLRARNEVVVCAVGVCAFAAGRVLAAGHAPTRFTAFALATNALAAVAEEVWFRRVCFGLLEAGGTVYAIAASSVLFAVVHVALYGPGILVVDLAAGALLGWQRAVTGSWRASAITHVAANLFVLL
jgi:hypothetical protein